VFEPVGRLGNSRRNIDVSLTTRLNALSLEVRNLGSSRNASETSLLNLLNRVTAHKETILAECADYIRNNETQKLQLMFKLMDRVPDEGIAPMLDDLEAHIYDNGIADMVESADVITQDSEKYVERLLTLFKRFSKLVSEAFRDDPRFLTSRDKAFKRVVNDTSIFRLELPNRPTGYHAKTLPESKCPELLANYCDMLLRKTPLSKKLSSDEVEAKLRDVLLVLKYVQNKDVFMRYAKAHLTRRLILDTSADSEKEENMVEWLREVGMPADFINKLSRMFQDIKVSEDLNSQFKGHLSKAVGKQSLAETVSIKILNMGAWARTSERVPVTLPRELEDYIPEVEEFYKSKHSGRRLQWHHYMSNGTITMKNSMGKFDLEVTAFQMSILFCWGRRRNDKLAMENLRLATELPEQELRRNLWTLVAARNTKRQVLLYEPSASRPSDFKVYTIFYINNSFAIQKNGKLQTRGRLNLIGRLQLSTEKTCEEDNERIIRLREMRIQEAIVKILKMRKKILNVQLQSEVIDLLKNMFLPSKRMMKEQIQWLTEQKYMKRSEEDINIFMYMA
jgi:cullin-5